MRRRRRGPGGRTSPWRARRSSGPPGLISQAGQLRGIGELAFADAGAAMNATAWRLPSVIVPVLSSSKVFTSPAASTALPLIASTLCCITRSMPAMPIADNRPPIVVGIRHTSSAT